MVLLLVHSSSSSTLGPPPSNQLVVSEASSLLNNLTWSPPVDTNSSNPTTSSNPSSPPNSSLLVSPLRGVAPPIRGLQPPVVGGQEFGGYARPVLRPPFFIQEIYKNGFLKRLPYNEKRSSAIAKLMKSDRYFGDENKFTWYVCMTDFDVGSVYQ